MGAKGFILISFKLEFIPKSYYIREEKLFEEFMEEKPKPESVIAGDLECIIFEPALLGEGPVWDSGQKKLIWVDIDGKKLHFWDYSSKKDTSYDMGETIGAAAPINNGKVLVALEHKISIFDPKDNTATIVVDLGKEIEGTRFNDGKCDSKGRFWIGTMDFDKTSPLRKGKLFRLDRDRKLTLVIEGVKTSNGLDWSLNDDVMYYTDTPTLEISAFKFDAEKGEISEKRTAITFKEEWGRPDGCTMDSEGKLWVACFSGSSVRRFDPATGELLEVLKVPVKHVTSVCFGGEDHQTLFITTSRHKLSEEEAKANPLAGCVFAVKTKVKGRTQKVDFEKEF